MRIVVAWIVGIWTLVQLTMLSIKFWARTDWCWATVLAPTEFMVVAFAGVGLFTVLMLWSLARAWGGEDCDGDR